MTNFEKYQVIMDIMQTQAHSKAKRIIKVAMLKPEQDILTVRTTEPNHNKLCGVTAII